MAAEKVRLGGMALANGVLVHGPSAWACAVRTDDGELKVVARRKRFSGAKIESPLLRGPARLADALSIIPQLRRALPEARLPFDVVFLINRFLEAASQAVVDAGGQPNQFVGDGLLALFGLDVDPATACRQALRAASLVASNIEYMNHEFAAELRRAVIYGSVMGSFCCEKFGVDRFRTLTRGEIEARYQEFKNCTAF